MLAERTHADFSDVRAFQLSAAGGVQSTMADLASFLEQLLAGQIVTPESLVQMQAWEPFSDQDAATLEQSGRAYYGMGLAHGEKYGVIGHNGQTLSTASFALHYDGSGRTVVMFSNARPFGSPSVLDLGDDADSDGLFR